VSAWSIWVCCVLLAIVSALQVAIFARISKTIARQASFEKLFSRQWVDVERWSIASGGSSEVVRENNLGRQAEGTGAKKPDDSLPITVSFDLVNRTSFPLTIDSISISAGIMRGGDWLWRIFEESARLILQPHHANGDSPESCMFVLELGPDELIRYATNGVFMRVHLRVFYSNSEEERIHQDFPVEALLKAGTPAVFTKYRSRRIREVERSISGNLEN
jgi:hypothetical protein